MSYERQPDGTMLGCGPDADYSGRDQAERHWQRLSAEVGEYWKPKRKAESEGERFFAKNPSGKEDWPNWFVADRAKGGLNVTAHFFPERQPRPLFGAEWLMRQLASEANAGDVPRTLT